MTLRGYSLSFAVALCLAFTPAAHASGDEAWVQFAKDVTAKCLKAVGASLTKATITVDPYGSESYGLAIVTGKSVGVTVSYICVMDKKSGVTEIGGELEFNVIKKAKP